MLSVVWGGGGGVHLFGFVVVVVVVDGMCLFITQHK